MAWCDSCRNFMWGLRNQGYKCKGRQLHLSPSPSLSYIASTRPRRPMPTAIIQYGCMYIIIWPNLKFCCVLVCSFEAYRSACTLTVELVVHLFRQPVEHVHIMSAYERLSYELFVIFSSWPFKLNNNNYYYVIVSIDPSRSIQWLKLVQSHCIHLFRTYIWLHIPS